MIYTRDPGPLLRIATSNFAGCPEAAFDQKAGWL